MPLISRRDAIFALASATVWPPIGWTQTSAADKETEEKQRGDPDAPYEILRSNLSKIEHLVAPSRATFERRAPDFAGLVGPVAAEYVGRSRDKDRGLIEDMLALFDLPFEWSGGQPVPFCASGLAYVVAMAYAKFWSKPNTTLSTLRTALSDIDHHHFFPSPSVRHMLNVADAKNRWKAKSDGLVPAPGWLVVYDFGGGADHVGMVIEADKQGLKAFECNTSGMVDGNQRNGGVIATRARDFKHVKGYIRTELARAV